MERGTLIASMVAMATSCVLMPSEARAIDDAHRQQARRMIDRTISYLRAQQDAETGAWGVSPDGRNFPAITGLVLIGMLDDPRLDAGDPAISHGLEWMLSYQQPDGGVYDQVLPSYNTAIAISAMARADTPEADAAMPRAVAFLRGLQWSEDVPDVAKNAPDAPTSVPVEHAFYGGVGYGRHGRPDMSNTGFFLDALHDSGASAEDPSVQKALVFLRRVQMDDRVNDMAYAEGSRQGGFVYATSESKDSIGQGQSAAGTIEETLSDGTVASRLRCYGSMTYAGFKSFAYASLAKDDPRVVAAAHWITENYTLEENPGAGTDGVYYYLMTFAKALDAWGLEELSVRGDKDEMIERDWANDLIDRLATLQNDDGSFRSVDDRWMENNTVLITSYALIALQHAAN
ncbi:MAG: terpene cyclase/mutase family protein [Phycisphaerales bacterium]|jgi:squalene-hopene/tetraprenyl-beta-curcumene cyclase|nr:terpene cyclase/mutase family protein [Phycisphaerales bacterium]